MEDSTVSADTYLTFKREIREAQVSYLKQLKSRGMIDNFRLDPAWSPTSRGIVRHVPHLVYAHHLGPAGQKLQAGPFRSARLARRWLKANRNMLICDYYITPIQPLTRLTLDLSLTRTDTPNDANPLA